MTQISIRPFTAGDVDIYRELRTEMVSNHPEAFDVNLAELLSRDDSGWTSDSQAYLSDPNRERFIAKTTNEYPVGIVGVLAREAALEIGGLYVRPEFRRNRVGQLLLDKCFEFAVAKSFTKTSLWVSVANPVARDWYMRVGFEPTNPPTIKQWWDGSGLSEEYLELRMTK